MTPFEWYFTTHFPTSLRNVGKEVVFSDGSTIAQASWDRRAAYLLWLELGRPGATSDRPPEATCSVCGEPQYPTPAGDTCRNGHEGAPATTDDAFDIL